MFIPLPVTSTARPPVIGWCDNWAGVSRIGYDVAQGYARVVPGDGTNIFDMIPVDYCANLTLAAAAKCPRSVFNLIRTYKGHLYQGLFIEACGTAIRYYLILFLLYLNLKTSLGLLVPQVPYLFLNFNILERSGRMYGVNTMKNYLSWSA